MLCNPEVEFWRFVFVFLTRRAWFDFSRATTCICIVLEWDQRLSTVISEYFNESCGRYMIFLTMRILRPQQVDECWFTASATFNRCLSFCGDRPGVAMQMISRLHLNDYLVNQEVDLIEVVRSEFVLNLFLVNGITDILGIRLQLLQVRN